MTTDDEASKRVIRAEFDRIARLEQGSWTVNTYFAAMIVRQLPAHVHAVLEVGCGTGALALMLAQRSDRVLALDFSPESIRIARERAQGQPGLVFELADAQTYDLGVGRYDAVVTNMVLHIMPSFALMLARLRDALAPGGTLVIVDRHHSNTAVDVMFRIVTVPVLRWLRLVHTGHLRRRPQVRAAYNERTFAVPNRSFAEIQREAAILPGVQVRRLLMNRYLLVWRKPT